VSGALPETERERQLRQLAGRLLHWPDPEGPVTADLLPVGYPDDLPPEIVDRTELRFLGSVVHRRAGALVGAEMVFEGPGEPEDAVSSYETALVGLGWERVAAAAAGRRLPIPRFRGDDLTRAAPIGAGRADSGRRWPRGQI
jgi:hypothetical protein